MTTTTMPAPAPPPPPEPEPAPWGRRLLIGAVVVGAVAVVVTVKVRWWRRGGARRTVTKLAEAGAVVLADAIVDELLPSA